MTLPSALMSTTLTESGCEKAPSATAPPEAIQRNADFSPPTSVPVPAITLPSAETRVATIVSQSAERMLFGVKPVPDQRTGLPASPDAPIITLPLAESPLAELVVSPTSTSTRLMPFACVQRNAALPFGVAAVPPTTSPVSLMPANVAPVAPPTSFSVSKRGSSQVGPANASGHTHAPTPELGQSPPFLHRFATHGAARAPPPAMPALDAPA